MQANKARLNAITYKIQKRLASPSVTPPTSEGKYLSSATSAGRGLRFVLEQEISAGKSAEHERMVYSTLIQDAKRVWYTREARAPKLGEKNQEMWDLATFD